MQRAAYILFLCINPELLEGGGDSHLIEDQKLSFYLKTNKFKGGLCVHLCDRFGIGFYMG